jgi:hypothetical protein
MSSNPRRAPVCFRIHHPTRAAGPWRRHRFIMPRHVRNYVHRIVLQFYVYFCVVLPSCGQSLSLCPASSSSCAILSQAGLLDVLATNLGSLDYFLAWGPVLLNGCSMEKLMLNGGFRVCSLLSLVLYPKHVYFVSLTLTTEYWGSRQHMPLNKATTIT